MNQWPLAIFLTLGIFAIIALLSFISSIFLFLFQYLQKSEERQLVRMLVGSDGQVTHMLKVLKENKDCIRRCKEYLDGTSDELPKGVMKYHGLERKAVENEIKRIPKEIDGQMDHLMDILRKNIEQMS